MTLTDIDLLRRFVQQRADDAFAELVHRHIDLVYRAALRMVGNRHLAEDVTQSVFTALAWKAPSLLQHRTLVGWLYTATRFAANEALRTERRRRRHEQEASAMQEPPAVSSPHVDWDRLRPVIDDVLGELKESDREAVLLRFFADLPFTAVGAALGVSENTARMRVDRALDKLHSLLARRGITSTSTSAALAMALAAQGTAIAAPTALAASVTGAAVASYTAATGAAAATTILMSVSKVQVSLGVAAALLLGAALYENRVARRIEDESRIAHANLTAMIAKRAALERTLRDAQRAQSALQNPGSSVSGVGSVTPAMPAAESQMEIIRDRYLQRRAVARSDPEYQRLHAAQRKLHANQHYGPLYRRLNLSAERVAAFEAMMAEHAGIIDDIEAAAETKRVPVWDSSVDKLKATAQEQLHGKLRTLLGEENYAVFQQYEQSATLRSSVTGIVAVALYATPTPLTASQAETLTEILNRHARFERDGSKDAGSVNWPAALADAERVLAPAQVEALRGVYAQRRWSDTLAGALSPMVGAQPPAK